MNRLQLLFVGLFVLLMDIVIGLVYAAVISDWSWLTPTVIVWALLGLVFLVLHIIAVVCILMALFKLPPKTKSVYIGWS